MSYDFDTVVIGAGAAGLTAALVLANEGVDIAILEAQDRLGGRIFTVHDPVTSAPVELGAEFVHGRPPEIWDIASAEKIPITEVSGEDWSLQGSRLESSSPFGEIEDILSQMSEGEPDRSFAEFLANAVRMRGNKRKRELLLMSLAFTPLIPLRSAFILW